MVAARLLIDQTEASFAGYLVFIEIIELNGKGNLPEPEKLYTVFENLENEAK